MGLKLSQRHLGWRGAYMLAFYNAAFFAAGSLCFLGFGFDSVAGNAALAAIFSLGAGLTGALLIMNGGVLAALPFFIIGAGVFYGIGTVLATMDTESMASLSFTADAQRAMLTKVNAVNAVSIFFVIATAGLFCANGPMHLRSRRSGMASTLRWLDGLQNPLLLLSLPYLLVIWMGFGQTQGAALNSLLSVLRGLPLFAILLGAIAWPRLSATNKFLVAVLAIGIATHGVLMLGKLATLVPLITLAIGWWLSGRMRAQSMILLGLIVAIYFAGFAEIVRLGRFHPLYEPTGNTIAQRIDILVETVDKLEELSANDREGAIAQRFTLAPFEAFFINSYDTGSPGDSLKNMATVLIPRFIWPDKPAVTAGRDFDLIFRGYDTQSWLAIGFPAEAYWNRGWLAVVLIAIMIGAQMGWLTHKWFCFVDRGAGHIGLFVFSPLVLFQAFWVEANIVGGYVGGMVKLMIIILSVDMIARWLMARHVREAEDRRLAHLRMAGSPR